MNLKFLNERSAVVVVIRFVANNLNKMTNAGYVPKSWRCQYDFQRNCSVSKAETVTRTLGKKRTVRLWKFFNFNKRCTITQFWQQKGAINNSRITLKALTYLGHANERTLHVDSTCVHWLQEHLCKLCSSVAYHSRGGAIPSPFISVASANKRTTSFFTHCNAIRWM